MTEKIIITLVCPFEKNHIFQQTFDVNGLGLTEVQVFCPHCKKMGTYEITWNVIPAIEYRGGAGVTPPPYFIKDNKQ